MLNLKNDFSFFEIGKRKTYTYIKFSRGSPRLVDVMGQKSVGYVEKTKFPQTFHFCKLKSGWGFGMMKAQYKPCFTGWRNELCGCGV